MSRPIRSVARLVAATIAIAASACRDATAPGTPPDTTPPVPPVVVAPAPAPVAFDTAAARTAWAFVEQNTTASTGLANAIYPFQFVTAWDIASLIGATWSAHALGILGDSAYDARMRATLGTLRQAPLFEGAAFNKSYDSHTGLMIDRNRAPSAAGYGWSATDVGRLLVWLRIVAVSEPQYASLASAIVARVDFSRLIRSGTLQGLDIDPTWGTRRSYAETGLGYEQYAAAGYALWGHRAAASLDPTANARFVDVYGVPVATDARGHARITSEPYMMMGLEIGWYTPALRTQAQAVLAAQEARYRSTGIITMVSEDALPDPPYFFYYYSVFRNGRTFVVEGPDEGSYTEQPRWVSTKAAHAWHALFPSLYTRVALDVVQRAAVPGRGWGAGVYESTGQPVGEPSLNTAAIVLESLLYGVRGKPFLEERLPGF
ncbi:MAG: hypothetical protein JWL60_1417 [Gemmatimonadetes bacterium]|jgi:hypothetical protein|nr:hypothetical protein [Gemmatimonadota bacterium]